MSRSEPNLKTEAAITKTRKAFPELTAKLKASDLEVQNYVTALEKENINLHRNIAKQQAEYMSLQSQIQVRAEEEAQRIIDELKLIEEAEEEANRYNTS